MCEHQQTPSLCDSGLQPRDVHLNVCNWSGLALFSLLPVCIVYPLGFDVSVSYSMLYLLEICECYEQHALFKYQRLLAKNAQMLCSEFAWKTLLTKPLQSQLWKSFPVVFNWSYFLHFIVYISPPRGYVCALGSECSLVCQELILPHVSCLSEMRERGRLKDIDLHHFSCNVIVVL